VITLNHAAWIPTLPVKPGQQPGMPPDMEHDHAE
jgi:hypothetical protein